MPVHNHPLVHTGPKIGCPSYFYFGTLISTGFFMPVMLWLAVKDRHLRPGAAIMAIGCAVVFIGTLLDLMLLFFAGVVAVVVALRYLDRLARSDGSSDDPI
jgi:hypothetical protein